MKNDGKIHLLVSGSPSGSPRRSTDKCLGISENISGSSVILVSCRNAATWVLSSDHQLHLSRNDDLCLHARNTVSLLDCDQASTRFYFEGENTYHREERVYIENPKIDDCLYVKDNAAVTGFCSSFEDAERFYVGADSKIHLENNPNLCINLAFSSTVVSDCDEVLFGMNYNVYYGFDNKLHYSLLDEPNLDSSKSSDFCLNQIVSRFQGDEPFLANILNFIRLILGVPLVPLQVSELK